jgi:hypothetical protein
MTVLFAFASPEEQAAFIAADSLEWHRKVTVDKVQLCWRRFAVGVYGLDTLLQAVQYISYPAQDAGTFCYSGGTKLAPLTDVSTVCAQAAACIPRLAAWYRNNLDKQLNIGKAAQSTRLDQ